MAAPRDPYFYVDLDAMAQRVGARSEDLLLVWSSETQLDPQVRDANGTPSASAHTISTIMHYSAVPSHMDEATWNRLPNLNAREQLPWIEKIVYAPAHKALGRAFRNAFEVYLVNAAPGLLRSDGVYNRDSAMYVGSNYPDNWPMDNFPAGAQQAQKDGVRFKSPRDAYDYAKSLVDRGLLKGYVSLGDLEAFAKLRINPNAGVFKEALGYLGNVRDNVAAKLVPSVDPAPSGMLTWQPASYSPGSAPSYQPDFDSAFPAGAPRDDRVATPSKAKSAMPRRAGGTAPRAISWPALGFGAAVAVGIAFLLRRS